MNMIILVLNGTSSTDVGIAEYFEMLVGRLIDANGMESWFWQKIEISKENFIIYQTFN